MKIIMLLLIALLVTHPSFAQEIKKDSNFCSCNYKVEVSYPDVSEEDQLEGIVIVEYEIDSTFFAANPKVIQSLGTAFDKEALRAINLMILLHNKCRSKCRLYVSEKRKVKLPISFKKPEDED